MGQFSTRRTLETKRKQHLDARKICAGSLFWNHSCLACRECDWGNLQAPGGGGIIAQPMAVESDGIFKDVRFYPILNFGHFWAPLFFRCFLPHNEFWPFFGPPFFKMSGFYPTRNFGQFWPDLHFFSCQRHFFGRRGGPKS